MLLKNLCAATILALASAPVLAAECSVDIAGNDQMQFDKKEITVSKSCKQFTVNLKHPGTLAKNVMGHNWVLTKQADMQGAVNDGMAAGLDTSVTVNAGTGPIEHRFSGVIRVEGVTSQGEFVASTDLLIDQIVDALRKEVRFA